MARLMAFEQGYKAFLEGTPKEQNPFDKETSPVSMVRWAQGWQKALADRRPR